MDGFGQFQSSILWSSPVSEHICHHPNCICISYMLVVVVVFAFYCLCWIMSGMVMGVRCVFPTEAFWREFSIVHTSTCRASGQLETDFALGVVHLMFRSWLDALTHDGPCYAPLVIMLGHHAACRSGTSRKKVWNPIFFDQFTTFSRTKRVLLVVCTSMGTRNWKAYQALITIMCTLNIKTWSHLTHG